MGIMNKGFILFIVDGNLSCDNFKLWQNDVLVLIMGDPDKHRFSLLRLFITSLSVYFELNLEWNIEK